MPVWTRHTTRSAYFAASSSNPPVNYQEDESVASVPNTSNATNVSSTPSKMLNLTDTSDPQQPRKRRATKQSTPNKVTRGTTSTATSVVDSTVTGSKVSPSPTQRKKRQNSTAINDDNTLSESPKSTKSANKSKRRLVLLPQPPPDWESVYALVEELRKDRTAPCDHSGCEALAAESLPAGYVNNGSLHGTDELSKTYRFQVLISLMLSSQTKDAVVGAAVRAMQKDGVLTVSAIHAMDENRLKQYIAKVGFFNNKTKYIKETVEILLNQYDGDIPRTAQEMIQLLPGIGPKMAYICEGAAWNTYSGIGVDTHMHRIFTELQWVNKTSNPEQTRIQLESWLPKSYWADVNLLWVGFGQEVQQEKVKLLRKALACSRPADALKLLKRCKFDYNKVAEEANIGKDEIESALKSSG